MSNAPLCGRCELSYLVASWSPREMSSLIAVDDEVARDLHESMHLDLGAGEHKASPMRQRAAERRSGRVAAPLGGRGGVGHSVSHGMLLQFPHPVERHAEDESNVLRAAEETLHTSADASRMTRRKPIVAVSAPARAAGVSSRTSGPLVTERDEKPAVDWRSEPDIHVAEVATLLSRPVYVPDPADESIRIPFDRADAELDRHGYPTGRTLSGGAVPVEFPLWETTVEDLGRIGGVGLRMYFTVVRGLAFIFALLALCSIPALVATGTGGMFDVFDAQMYGCAGEACIEAECCSTSDTAAVALPGRPQDTSADCKPAVRGTCDGWQTTGGVCPGPSQFVATLTTPFLTRLTLGNICATRADVESGSVPALWVIAVVGVITSLALVVIVLRASAHMKNIKQDTDASMVSMSDYTVRLVPTSEHWHEYVKVASGKRDVVKGTQGVEELTHDVEEALERSMPGARVAAIGSKPMIVIAWNEDQNIQLWAEKIVALRKLEEAIAVAFRAHPDSKQRLDQALKKLDKINHAENALNRGPNARKWRPVSVFVTFEQDEHREDALKLGRIKVGSQECLVVPADEPEAIQWANLQYSKRSQRIRRGKIHIATVVILLLGFVLLIYFNVLKESAASSHDPADKSAAQTWATVATFAVVAINQLLKRMMIAITPYEKAHTLDEYQGGVAIRVFMCQLFNTAILMLFLRSNLSIVSAIPGDHFEHVNARWYATVGAPLVGTMFIQFLTPLVVKIVSYAVSTFKVRMSADKTVTQHALNRLMAPDEFNIAASFGEVLLAATVSLLFGGGIPILYWVAAAGFALRCVFRYRKVEISRIKSCTTSCTNFSCTQFCTSALCLDELSCAEALTVQFIVLTAHVRPLCADST